MLLASNEVGGLIGNLDQDATVDSSYSSGQVTLANGVGAMLIGGFIGSNSGTVQNSYWDVDSSLQASGCALQPDCNTGATAINAANRYSLATYGNLTIDTNLDEIWTIFDGDSRPLLTSSLTPTIFNAHQLQLVGKAPDGDYNLVNNIDLTGISNTSNIWNNNSFIPIGDATTPFTGNFHGNGNAIVNLTINQSNVPDVGLFGVTDGANINTLGLVNPNVTATTNQRVGSLVGLAQNGTTISMVYSTNGSVIGPLRAGGIVGALEDSSMSNSYNTSTVTSQTRTGGLVGFANNSEITSSYSSGLITGAGEVGGLVGLLGGGSVVSNSYWDSDTSSLADACGSDPTCSNGATEIDNTNRFDISAYADLDITQGINRPWTIFDGATRPLLSSEFNTTIATPHQLQLIGKSLAENYTLANNLSLTGLQNDDEIWGTMFNGPGGFLAIGSFARPFSGSLQGNGYDITNLYISKMVGNQGLFSITNHAIINDLQLSEIDINAINSVFVGGLIGTANNSTIANVHVSNSDLSIANIAGAFSAGGIIGLADNTNANRFNQCNVCSWHRSYRWINRYSTKQ